MNEKLIRVFYGVDSLPYKDKERTTHFPIVGSAFMGASNVTEIRFYVDRLGTQVNQWMVIGKLPNGKKGFKLLNSPVYDYEENEYYYSFLLGNFFTQAKGDLFISLGGYNGSDVELNEDDIYELLDNVVTEVTGTIKLNIAYAVNILPEDSRIEEWQELLAALGQKLDITNGIVVLKTQHDTLSGYDVDIASFDDGQIFYLEYQPLRGLYIKSSGSLSQEHRFIGLCHRAGTMTNGTELSESVVEEAKKRYCLFTYTNYNQLFLKTSEYQGIATFVRVVPTVNNSTHITISEQSFKLTYSTRKISDFVSTTYDLPTKAYLDGNFANLGTENVFDYAPQTNETIDDASADTKLTTKKYVKDLMNEHLGDYQELYDEVNGSEDIVGIVEKIPSQASDTNKLADRDWVNSTINSLAAFYITKNAQGDPFSTYAELMSTTTFYSGGVVRVPTRNDYCLVVSDENHDNASCRYIYQGNQWEFQFVVNETPFTSDQLKAINSGITDILVAQITNNQNAITTINSKLPKIKDFVIPTTSWKLNELDNYDTFTNTSDYIGYYVIYNSQYEKVTNDNKDDLSIIAGTTIAYTGNFFAELDAGVDFVIDDNAMKNYCGTNANDQNLIGALGIIASSDSTTQKFKFECYRSDTAPTEVINFTIAQFGGN